MPNGSTMEDTAAIQDRIAGIVMDTVPETKQIYYSTGDSTSIMSSASGASVTVSLVDLDKRDRSAQEVTKQLRRDLADIAGCEITVSASESMGMSTDSDISVELTGSDYDQLADTANDLVQKIEAIPDAINVESSAGEQTPRVAVKVRRENASRFGLPPAAIGGLVRGELTGSTATTLRMNGEEYDVTVSGDEDVATSLDSLRSMQLPTATGGNVPLSSVADVYTELSPQSIVRKNQKETVTITRIFAVHREGRLTFRQMIRKALTKADGKLSDGIHPYQMEDVKPYESGYLSGFLAEKRDIEQDAAKQSMVTEAKGYAERMFTSVENPYNTLTGHAKFEPDSVKTKYLLLPAWVLTYKHRADGEPYYYMMNGQTGRICGKLPINKGKLYAVGALIGSIVFGLLCLGGAILW
ncbi:MAG: efflux RND transporter permease subunit [Clostridiales bacterium]|nr:efflux RND transporter permease subunit [Clostridiales bacterium]